MQVPKHRKLEASLKVEVWANQWCKIQMQQPKVPAPTHIRWTDPRNPWAWWVPVHENSMWRLWNKDQQKRVDKAWHYAMRKSISQMQILWSYVSLEGFSRAYENLRQAYICQSWVSDKPWSTLRDWRWRACDTKTGKEARDLRLSRTVKQNRPQDFNCKLDETAKAAVKLCKHALALTLESHLTIGWIPRRLGTITKDDESRSLIKAKSFSCSKKKRRYSVL